MLLPIQVLIPVYGAAKQLRNCLDSLVAFLPDGCDVEVLDDASPGIEIQAMAQEFGARVPWLKYCRRERNLGFVENCNEAMVRALPTGRDVLLLNSDTQVTEGAIEEMFAVLRLHEKHGAVTPRSNRATIYSVPVFEMLEPCDSYELWRKLQSEWNRYEVMPTGVGFCLLIRNEVLRFFGVFDPIYSPGYNEENDLICRMNRRGYSPVMANRAFVFHFEAQSFGERRKLLERRNREFLDERYPEYSRCVSDYFRYLMDPVDRFAALWHEGRKKKILIDLFHLPATHSGTSEFALSLVLYLAPLLENRYELNLGLSGDAREFFAAELAGYSIFDESRFEHVKFDVVFKPCQIFSWQELHRMARLGGRIAYTHQDSIAVRCKFLAGPLLETLHRRLPEVVDKIIAISRFSKKDYEAFYGKEADFEIIHSGTHGNADSRERGDYVLIVGNGFPHKGLEQALRALQGATPIKLLGGERPLNAPDDVEWLESGHLGRAEVAMLFADARLIVYPSFYEGFGLPVLDGLALGKPVVALDLEIGRELQGLAQDPNLHLVKSHEEMRWLVGQLWHQEPYPARIQRNWAEVALEYAESLIELAERPLDTGLLRRRWHLLAGMDSFSALQ
ncbi:MAG: glycosyltransferase [Acidobacteriota bacterium]|nr:glycosyltransferase [Acidobacteriota bacterium]